MEKSANEKLKLGLFVMVGISLFIAAIYFIGQKQNLFGNSTSIFALFNNTNGLKIGNNVRFSGINVGTVNEINMLGDTTIVVKISIDKDIMPFIKEDATAAITSDGLVGSMIINIIPTNKSSIKLNQNDTIRSLSRIRTDEMLNTLSVTNENAALLTSELLKITKTISSGQGLIGALIQDSTLKRDLHLILDNVNRMSNESSIAIKNINKLVTSLDHKDNLIGTLRDTSLSKQLKRIVKNIEISSNEIKGVISNLDSTITNVNSTVINIRDGQGAINYLSNDHSLVRKIDHTVGSLDGAIRQLNDAGVRLNENLEALKHNFLLKGYFKNLEKEKLKAVDKK